MSKCDLEIVFDRPNRTYRGGDELSGTVHVQVNQDVRCDGLVVEHFWQTHGQGNTATGPKQSSVVFQGDLQAGQAYSFPFRFTVPDGPPTYHGHYLNVDHYIHARVDIPWAIDPKLKEEYLLLPGDSECGNLPPDRNQQPRVGRQFLKLGLPIGVAMIVGGVLVLFPCGIVLIPLGCLVVFLALRQSLAEKRIGKVELTLGSLRVAPGGEVPLALSFTPRQSCTLNGITAHLLAIEQCVSGSGTNKSTHTHKVHQRRITLAGQGQLTAGQPVQVKTAVPIPQTNAFSFSASDNDLIWTLEVRIDIPLWPDWVEKRVLTVRPAPAAELAEKQPGPPPPPLEARKARAGQEAAAVFPTKAGTAAAADLGSAGMTLSMGSEVTFHQPPPEPSPAELPAEATPAALEQPAPGAAAVDSTLRQLLDRLSAASRYGSERDEIIREFAERSFPCSIEIDGIERTYTYVPDQRFRNGRTVTGMLRGTHCEVAVQLPEERNDELATLAPGDTLQANCKLVKWNNIHDRLEMREL
jgi:hypothetical protein